jgi:acyl-CoA reductase-like NAD-dependent aldehyde dehydrogenase
MRIINPATEQLIKEVDHDTLSSLQGKFHTLRQSCHAWKTRSLRERVSVLQKFGDHLVQQTESLSAILTSEVGKPLQQSRNEIKGAKARIDWLTAHAVKYLSDEIVREDGEMTERIAYEPLGVICNISAWNYPYLVGVNVFIPALLAGNTVMYKPSEFATLSGMEIQRLLYEAGVPTGAFQVAIGASTVGQWLLQIPFDGYFFTGSFKTGKFIYETVSPKMVPCQLELGGKDPLYVCDDIRDVAAVAAATADGAFYNNGQSCCAVERIYVHEKVYDAYVDAFIREVKSYKMGDPTADGTYIGPLTRKAQRDILVGQIEDAQKKGAVIATGGTILQRSGYFFEPTVMLNVTHEMAIMQEESFGPVIGIMKVANDDEALKLMQDTPYGLTAAVYSEDQNRAERILEEMNTGSGYWNCCDRVSAALPWSGRNHSGIGATLSHMGIRAFTRPKGYHLRKLG